MAHFYLRFTAKTFTDLDELLGDGAKIWRFAEVFVRAAAATALSVDFFYFYVLASLITEYAFTTNSPRRAKLRNL